MIDWSQLTLYLYILARMSGFVLFNPILGRQGLPGLFRSGLIFGMTAAAGAVTTQAVTVPNTLPEMMLRLVLELALGYLLAMAMNFFFYIPQLAGMVIDTQMGMTMNQVYDPGSQASMSVTGAVLNALMTLLFFAAQGHHTLIRIMATSSQLVPYGAAAVSNQALELLVQLFVECTVLGVKLCMPILAAELVGQIGMGVLMKFIPQINVFSINIELKVIIGLGLTLALMSPFSEFLLRAESQMLDSMSRILSLAAG